MTAIVKDSSAARNGLLIHHNLVEVNGQVRTAETTKKNTHTKNKETNKKKHTHTFVASNRHLH